MFGWTVRSVGRNPQLAPYEVTAGNSSTLEWPSYGEAVFDRLPELHVTCRLGRSPCWWEASELTCRQSVRPESVRPESWLSGRQSCLPCSLAGHTRLLRVYCPRQYRYLSDRINRRFPSTAGLALKILRSSRLLTDSCSNPGLAESTKVLPCRVV